MIKAVYLHNLRDAEYLNFIAAFITLTQEHQSEVLQIETELENVKQQQQFFETTFKQQRYNDLTSLNQELDQERDDTLVGMHSIIKGYTYSFDPILKEAVGKLQNHIKQYGKNLTKLNYQAETAVIDNILAADWGKMENLNSALAVLNLDAWKAYLKTKNTEFARIHLD